MRLPSEYSCHRANSGQLNSYIYLCIQPILVFVLVEISLENAASHIYVIGKGRNVLIVFKKYNYEYSSLISYCQNPTSDSFLKISSNVESEIICMDIYIL